MGSRFNRRLRGVPRLFRLVGFRLLIEIIVAVADAIIAAHVYLDEFEPSVTSAVATHRARSARYVDPAPVRVLLVNRHDASAFRARIFSYRFLHTIQPVSSI